MYRLAYGVLRRLGAFTVHNARRKQQLLDEWRILQARLCPDAVMLMLNLDKRLCSFLALHGLSDAAGHLAFSVSK